ncbi:MAG: hypothetical protein ACP5NX_00145 [Candidatus Bilamarchaeaceae archaeon]
MEINDVRRRIAELEKEKSALIERIKKLNGKIRYKQYEKKALEPFLEQTKDVRIAPLRKQKNILDFRISTQAYTPKIERELVKELKKIEEALEKVREVERGRRKIRLVEQDIVEAEAEIKKIEEALAKMREELKGLYGEQKKIKSVEKAGVKYGGFEDNMATLEEMGIIIEEKK